MGDFMWRLYKALYILCFHHVRINVEHDNGLILLLNTIIATLILCIIDTVFLVVVYKFVGFLRGIEIIDGYEMRDKHWKFRFLLTTTLLLLSFTPLFNIFYPVIDTVSGFIVEWFRGLIADMNNNISDIFNSWN